MIQNIKKIKTRTLGFEKIVKKINSQNDLVFILTYAVPYCVHWSKKINVIYV